MDHPMDLSKIFGLVLHWFWQYKDFYVFSPEVIIDSNRCWKVFKVGVCCYNIVVCFPGPTARASEL